MAELLDVLPPAILREAMLIIISTRPVNLLEEAERSSRLSGTSARGLLGRVILLNASQGDLDSLFQFAERPTRDLLQQRLEQRDPGTALEPGATRRRGLSSDDAGPEAGHAGRLDDGENRP